jgi:hypothetical protein
MTPRQILADYLRTAKTMVGRALGCSQSTWKGSEMERGKLERLYRELDEVEARVKEASR